MNEETNLKQYIEKVLYIEIIFFKLKSFYMYLLGYK